MIGDMLIVDAVVHPYNLALENQDPGAQPQLDAVFAMGLVEEVTYEAGRVRVVLCLTDPACVHFRSLQQYITDVLREPPEVRSVEGTQTTRTLWTPERTQLTVRHG